MNANSSSAKYNEKDRGSNPKKSNEFIISETFFLASPSLINSAQRDVKIEPAEFPMVLSGKDATFKAKNMSPANVGS